MSNDLNRLTLIGRMTRDPETNFIQSGTAVTKFSIANNFKYKEKETVSYFNCIAWGKLGEVIAEYTKKGSRVSVEGKIRQQHYEDKKTGEKKSSFEVTVDFVQFLDSRPVGEKVPYPKDIIASGTEIENPFSDSDVPF